MKRGTICIQALGGTVVMLRVLCKPFAEIIKMARIFLESHPDWRHGPESFLKADWLRHWTLDPAPCQLNSVHALTPCCFNVYFVIILPPIRLKLCGSLQSSSPCLIRYCPNSNLLDLITLESTNYEPPHRRAMHVQLDCWWAVAHDC
jgi:hypothetical protein